MKQLTRNSAPEPLEELVEKRDRLLRPKPTGLWNQGNLDTGAWTQEPVPWFFNVLRSAIESHFELFLSARRQSDGTEPQDVPEGFYVGDRWAGGAHVRAALGFRR
jgi:hypothetical protein